MRIFPILTAIRILITAGTTAANCPGISVATNASQPIAISVEKPQDKFYLTSPAVLENELLYARTFWPQGLPGLNRGAQGSCSAMN